MSRYGIIVLSLLFAAFAAPASAQDWCGEPPGHALDYLDGQRNRASDLRLVENRHFTEDVRTLRRGSSSYLINDIEYVLNWFPNHHGALDAFSRLAVREGTDKPSRATWPLECRFQWATRVNPKDPRVPLIQGVHHYRLSEYGVARKHLERAVKLAPNDAETQYSLGLVLFRLGEHQAALNHARRAYSLGYPLPGLKNMLAEAGYPL